MMISFLWTVGHPRTASHPTSASHHRLYVTILSTCSGDTKLACNAFAARMVLTRTWGWASQNFIDSENCPDKWLCDFILNGVWYGLPLSCMFLLCFLWSGDISAKYLNTHFKGIFNRHFTKSAARDITLLY